MPIITYISEQCLQDAKKFQATDALIKLKEKIEQEQALWNLEPFLHPFWVKKKLAGKSNRLILRIESHTIDGTRYDVLIFLTILLRSDKNYLSFYKNTSLIGDQFYKNYITPLDISNHLKHALNNNDIKNKPVLSQDARHFLHNSRSAIQYPIDGSTTIGSSPIYESWSWFQYVSNHLTRNELSIIKENLESHLGHGSGRVTLYKNDRHTFVLYRLPAHHINYLNVEVNNNVTAINEHNISYNQLLSVQNKPDELNQLIQKTSRRSYIQEVCTDFEHWYSIQNDLSANLVLSPEELTVLKSIQENTHPFPLFINGRAGSGKSTMLQILFTEYLLMAYNNYQNIALHPIYFSCSPSLTKKAIETTNSLLNTKMRDGNGSQALPDTKHYCYEFRSYLHSLIPKENKFRFKTSHYIGYSEFRRLWSKKFKSLTGIYNSGLSWHVIRSLIKGLHSDNFLEYDDYLELSKAKRNIEPEHFKYIFNNIWLNWYKPLCEKENYWDDQDLARFILEKNCITTHYPAIFCDESQDFTPIEFQVLLRLNTFSHHLIDAKSIQSIPIVFAGDQFQTLNPTGFRWENIKAQVVEQFIFSLDPSKSTTLSEMNYQELSYNFRCSHNIAKFSNTVHAIRAKSLELSGLQPQKSRHINNESQDIIFIDVNNDYFITQVKDQYDLSIILPCLDGDNDEIEYIKDNPDLSKLIDIDDKTNSTSIPVYSVIRAKGLEFKRIVIYGFGTEFSTLKYTNDEQRISLEYYLNRLYVAVTRAREQLWIIDTQENYDRFWVNFVNPATSEFNLQTLETPKTTWSKSLGTLKIAQDIDIVANFDQEADMQKNAEYNMNEGLVNKEAFLLRQASGLFEKLNDHKQHDYCLAEALFIEKDFLKAANLFKKIDHNERSFESYWCAADLNELTLAIKNNRLLTKNFRTLEICIVHLLQVKTHTLSDFTDIYTQLLNIQDITDSVDYLNTWYEFLAQSFVILLKYKNKAWNWNSLFSIVQKLKDQSYFSQTIQITITTYKINILAELAYLANNFESAYQLWQHSKTTYSLKPTTPQYEKACIQVLSFPETIPALLVLNDDERLLKQTYAYKTPDLIPSADWKNIFERLNQTHLKHHFKSVLNHYLPLLTKTNVIQHIHTQANNYTFDPLSIETIHLVYLFKCCIDGEWDTVIKQIQYFQGQRVTLEHLKFDEKSSKYKKAKQLEVVLYGLFLSDHYSKMCKKDKGSTVNQEIFTFIKRNFSISKNSKIIWKTTFKEAILIGGILERAQEFENAMNFYKALNSDQTLSTFSKQRDFQNLKRYRNSLSHSSRNKNKIKDIDQILESMKPLNFDVNSLSEYPETFDFMIILKCIIENQPFNYTPILAPEKIVSEKLIEQDNKSTPPINNPFSKLKELKNIENKEEKSTANDVKPKQIPTKTAVIEKKEAPETKSHQILIDKLNHLEIQVQKQQEQFDTALASYHSQIESLQAFTTQQTQYIETILEQHSQDTKIIKKLNKIIESQQNSITKALKLTPHQKQE